MDGNDSRWPPLSAERDGPTIAALHLFSQVIGKVPTALLPWRNHGWHLTLHPTPARPGDRADPRAGRHVRPELRPGRPSRRARRCARAARTLPLRPMSVADFHAGVMAMLAEAGHERPHPRRAERGGSRHPLRRGPRAARLRSATAPGGCSAPCSPPTASSACSAPASSARSARSISSGAASISPSPASPGEPRRSIPAASPICPTR